MIQLDRFSEDLDFDCKDFSVEEFMAMTDSIKRIHDLQELKKAATETINSVDLNHKKRDFEHLLFNKKNSERILYAGEFFRELK